MENASFPKKSALLLIAMISMHSSFALHCMNQTLYVPNFPENYKLLLNGHVVSKVGGKWYQWINTRQNVLLTPQPSKTDLAQLFASIKHNIANWCVGNPVDPAYHFNVRILQFLPQADKMDILHDPEVVEALFSRGLEALIKEGGTLEIGMPNYLYTVDPQTSLFKVDETLFAEFLLKLYRPHARRKECLLFEATLPRKDQTEKIIDCYSDSGRLFTRSAVPRIFLQVCRYLSAETRVDFVNFPEFKEALDNAIANKDNEALKPMLSNITKKEHLTKLLGTTNGSTHYLCQKSISDAIIALKKGDSVTASFALKNNNLNSYLINEDALFSAEISAIIKRVIVTNKSSVLRALFENTLSGTQRMLNKHFSNAFAEALLDGTAEEPLITLLSLKNTTGSSLTMLEIMSLLRQVYPQTQLETLFQCAISNNRFNTLELVLQPFLANDTWTNNQVLCTMVTDALTEKSKKNNLSVLEMAKRDKDIQNMLQTIYHKALHHQIASLKQESYNKNLTDRELLQNAMQALREGDSEKTCQLLSCLSSKETIGFTEGNPLTELYQKLVAEAAVQNKPAVLKALFDKIISETSTKKTRNIFSSNLYTTLRLAAANHSGASLTALLNIQNKTGADKLSTRWFATVLAQKGESLLQIAANNKNYDGVLGQLINPLSTIFSQAPLLGATFCTMMMREVGARADAADDSADKKQAQQPLKQKMPLKNIVEWANGDLDSQRSLKALYDETLLRLALSCYLAKIKKRDNERVQKKQKTK